MEWLRAALICVAGALLCSVLRPQRPEMAMGAAMAAGITAVGMILPVVRETVEIWREMARGTDMQGMGAVLRGTGIGLITDFSAQLCRDAGEGALASRAEMAGRAAMAALCAPMLLQLTKDISQLLHVSF